MLKLVATCFMLFLSAAAAAAAQEPAADAPTRDRDCTDDNGADRCDAARQRAVREMFGVPALEAFETAGTAVRRAFFVDGYGIDMPVVTFSRPAGQSPKVSVAVRVPAPGGAYRLAELTAPVSQAVWDEALSRSRYFERRFVADPPAPVAGAGPAPNTICMHSWVVTVEAWSPRGRDGPERAKRSTQSACGEGLAVPYAFELARLAVAALPACDLIDAARHRNDVARLQSCGLLSGDTLAAAQVVNASRNPFVKDGGPFTINSRASLEWEGETALGSERARELWGRKITPAHQLWPHRIEGESARRVRLTGEISTGDGAERRVAPYEQIWVNEIGLDSWAVERMVVGRLKPSA